MACECDAEEIFEKVIKTYRSLMVWKGSFRNQNISVLVLIIDVLCVESVFQIGNR